MAGTFAELDRKYLLVPKILFFTMNMAYYSCYTFRAKYLNETQGISTRDYGLLAAILSLIIFIGGYFWSFIADRTRAFRTILLICTIASAAVFQFFLIQFSPETRIALATVVSAFYIFFVSALVPLLDALVMHMLSVLPGVNKQLYGRQRLFGTLAYAVISISVGLSKKLKPIVNILIFVLSAIFCVMVVIFLPSRIEKEKGHDDEKQVSSVKSGEKGEIRLSTNISSPEKAQVKDGHHASNNLTATTGNNINFTTMNGTSVVVQKKSPFVQLMTNPNFLFLLLIVFMNGFARAIMTIFLEPIQRTVFRTPQKISGVSAFSGVFLEMVVYFFSPFLLEYMGPRKMLLCSQAAMVCRISCYAFLPRNFEGVRYMTLVYELFKGLSFGFMQSAAVAWVTEIAPPELKSTAQSVYSGIFSGFSAFVAGVVGYLVHNIGAQHNYGPNATKEQKQLEQQEEIKRSNFLLQLTSYISMFALVIFYIKYIIIDGRNRKKNSSSK